METKISSKFIYQGRNIYITQDQVLCENNIQSQRDCVRAKGGVAVLIVQNNQVLLVKQYRYLVNEETWEIPAGTREPSEPTLITAMRELEEEAHLKAEDYHLITEMYSTPGFCDESIFIYEAKNPETIENPKSMDEDENIQVHWFDLDICMKMIQNGQIKDAKTILAIQHAYINHLTNTK